MKKIKTFNLFIYIYFISIFNCLPNYKQQKIIISLTSNRDNIQNTITIINSIIEQNIDFNLFDILLILSLYEYSNISELPKEIQLLEKLTKIKVEFYKEKITFQRRTLITMKKYKFNPIIIINNICKLPEGWLDMFIKDHLKYPNDAIAASIQYFFGKNGEITELSEGFKGEKFGTFNHVTKMIFNFAIFNIDLGGILYPTNFFKTEKFYDYHLFMKTNNSEEFWESSFIIIENKILRQSSKIFDYTKYIINNINYNEFYLNKKILLEQNKLSFLREFSNFINYIKERQDRIIVSITSYPRRFVFLPDLMIFIRNQTFHINKIKIFLFKEDLKYYNLDIKDIEIISTDKNLKPHLKYFYAMKRFRDHAIITLDDDIGYAIETFESLHNAYIENPNVISGRRSHLMNYKNNGELKGYYEWIYEQNLTNQPDFNVILTNVGGTIFPPDILNINEQLLPIIKETITCDDLTLKFFSIRKGIPQKWIFNKQVLGVSRQLPKNNDSPLYKVNMINNDKCINKMNMMINTTKLKNLCIQYRNITTGNSLYLFDIHNQEIINNILYFDMFAYSYCPMDLRIKFNVYFDNYSSICFFNKSKILSYEKKNNLKNKAIISCYMNYTGKDLDCFIPSAKSEDNIIIHIYNSRKYLTCIFKEFFCEEINNCILKAILLENISNHNFSLAINKKYYSCKLDENEFFSIHFFPVIKNFSCYEINNLLNRTKTFISGIPSHAIINNKMTDNNFIPQTFIISRIVKENEEENKDIIIIGKLTNNLKKKFYNLNINFFYPQMVLKCNLEPNSKYVQSKIHCFNKKEINSKILIENQIIHSLIDDEEILLINEETLIKLEFNNNDDNIKASLFLQRVLNYSSLSDWFKKINILLMILIVKFISRFYKVKL